MNDAPASPLRVAIVAGGQNLFGKEIMALELGEGLRDRGHQVSFVSSLWCGDGEFGRRLHRAGIPAFFMRLGFISATLSPECIRMTLHQFMHVPGLWWDYTRFLREVKPEHVIHTNWHHLLMLWPFLSSQSDWFWLHEVVPDKPQYRFVFQCLAKRLRGFIPVSFAVRKSLLGISIPECQIHVVHNGIADPVTGNVSCEPSWKGIRIGIIGQVAAWKGHEDLLEAFAQVATVHREVELHIFGDDSQEFARMLKQRVKDWEIEPQVFWKGFVSDRPLIYRGLDLCVVPSRTADPLPTVAVEAAFFGLPVVASRMGGLPEIVEDGRTGLLHAPGDVADLARQLNTLIINAELRIRMGGAAREKALKYFSRERFVVEFEQLLRSGESFLQPTC
ncbi:MAG: glycosyltransferase family 4 protein [Verrucomicrobiaceae bacterium]